MQLPKVQQPGFYVSQYYKEIEISYHVKMDKAEYRIYQAVIYRLIINVAKNINQ